MKHTGAFSPSLVKDSFMTTFRKRPGPIRTYILLLITIILLDRIVDVGIDNNEYNYTRTKFEWVMDDYSQFQSIVISAIIIGISAYQIVSTSDRSTPFYRT